MEERIHTRLTVAAGRRFGLTIGIAFVAIAWVLGRTQDARLVALVLGAVGVIAIAGGILTPTRLGPFERAWMALARAISRVTTPILVAVLYFVVITPIGLVRRLMGRNALVRSAGGAGLAPGGYWVVRPSGRTRSDLKRQF